MISFVFTISFQLHAQTKEALRYEIDAKRGNLGYASKEALTSGREFKRIDSSYYVGWMFEGTYKFEHAADYLGFKNASLQLEKAMYLLDKDFKTKLQTRTTDVMQYIQNLKYHRDWDFTVYNLMQCYSNMDMPDKVWSLLQKCKKMDLQDEIYLDTYSYLAWTVHRNRFYTSSKYPFLKNSIDENEAYANKLLDSMASKIKRDAELNSKIFSADYYAEKIPGVWHYKSILFSYQLNIPSASYYYDKLKNSAYFPANNYATFCAIQGQFREAQKYYDIAKTEDAGDKRMKESFYYLSIINAYKNTNKKGIEELKNLIQANGSTPGFGWYNIALARNLIYDGQLQIAQRYTKRAEEFKEIHIGTTLGQSHYDFTVSLMQLISKINEIEAVKFENRDWWYSPSKLMLIAKLISEKYGLQFLIINQFASNPERDRVVYKIFSTESTISFDEVWQLIDGFSTNFFLKKFEKEISTEKRYQVKRYYRYFVAKLWMKKGDYKEAKRQLESVLNELQIDVDYEKLFLARVNQSLIECNKELNQNSNYNQEMLQLYLTYPQLIPFSSLTMPMRLHHNAKTDAQLKIISNLKNTNIDWVTSTAPAIDVYIKFTQKESIPIIQLYTSVNGAEIVPKIEFSYKANEATAKELSYYIFGIGNDDKNLNMGRESEK